MKRLIIPFILGALSLGAAESQHILREAKRLVIEDREFIYRRDIRDGDVTEEWYAEGRSVSEVEYTDLLLEAQKEEQRKKLALERERREAEHAKLKALQNGAARKLLSESVALVEAELKRIRSYEFEDHLHWGAATIPSSEEYERLVRHQLPQARSLASDSGAAMDLIKNMASVMDTYAKKLNRLFYSTAEYLIAHSTDTKILKRLVDLN